MTTFAQRLRQAREAQKLTRRALGTAAKVGENTIYAYESGNERGPLPRTETLARLAKALHCKPSSLLIESERAMLGVRPDVDAEPPILGEEEIEAPTTVGPILGNGDVVKYKLAAFAAKRGDPITVVARLLATEPPANDVDLDWWLALYLKALKETGK